MSKHANAQLLIPASFLSPSNGTQKRKPYSENTNDRQAPLF